MTNGLYPGFLLSTILARWIINVSLAVMLGYQIVNFFFLFQSTSRPTQIMPTPSTMQTSKTVDISHIVTARLFGTIPAAMEIAVANPETKLNLKLRGIYYAADNNMQSFAVIAETESKHHLYRQGATLSGGTVLQEIRPKEIILNRNGRYETLKLTSSPASTATTTPPSTTISNKISSDENLTPAQLLANYQQQLRENPQKLLSLVRIEAVEQNGKFSGFRLSPGRDATLLNRFNLKSGDILVAVNGTDLDSPLKGLGLIEQLGQTKQLNLTVLRNGQPLSLSFSVDK